MRGLWSQAARAEKKPDSVALRKLCSVSLIFLTCEKGPGIDPALASGFVRPGANEMQAPCWKVMKTCKSMTAVLSQGYGPEQLCTSQAYEVGPGRRRLRS